MTKCNKTYTIIHHTIAANAQDCLSIKHVGTFDELYYSFESYLLNTAALTRKRFNYQPKTIKALIKSLNIASVINSQQDYNNGLIDNFVLVIK